MAAYLFRDITIAETGSVRGSIESAQIEINGHVEGKISADSSNSWKKCSN